MKANQLLTLATEASSWNDFSSVMLTLCVGISMSVINLFALLLTPLTLAYLQSSGMRSQCAKIISDTELHSSFTIKDCLFSSSKLLSQFA